MTAVLAPAREASHALSLDSILAPLHDCWITRVAQVLAPAMDPGADFWARWVVVRFLSDDFDHWFRLERALSESLAALLEPVPAAALTRAREDLEECRAELTATGRRRGTAWQVAALSRRLLGQAQRWCAAFEFATVQLRPAEMPEVSRRLLEHIEALVRYEGR